MRFQTPFPFLGHRRAGNCLDTSSDLGFGQLVGADPSWIILATHVANLVNPGLEGGDPAADKGPQEIIASYTSLHKLVDDIVNLIDLEVRLLRVE